MQHILPQYIHKCDKPESGKDTSTSVPAWFTLGCNLHCIYNLWLQLHKESSLIVFRIVVCDHVMSMLIEILNCITVTLGHLLFGSTLHPITGA